MPIELFLCIFPFENISDENAFDLVSTSGNLMATMFVFSLSRRFLIDALKSYVIKFE